MAVLSQTLTANPCLINGTPKKACSPSQQPRKQGYSMTKTGHVCGNCTAHSPKDKACSLWGETRSKGAKACSEFAPKGETVKARKRRKR